MKDEIREGVEFLRQFLTKYGNQLTQSQIDLFAVKLTKMLEERYVNHWYVEQPLKGQAFRCLRIKRIENYIDPVLERLLNEMNLHLNQLGLPNDFTLWIDPGEVSVRFGDQVGYTYPIARVNMASNASSSSSSTSTSSSSSLLTSSLTSSDQAEAKPKLIVHSPEKIFDDKLTAFIRQNSTNSTIMPSSSSLNPKLNSDEDVSDLLSEEILNKLASSLTPEKRTISPPPTSHQPSTSLSSQQQVIGSNRHQSKRNNSSNIAIVNGDVSSLSILLIFQSIQSKLDFRFQTATSLAIRR